MTCGYTPGAMLIVVSDKENPHDIMGQIDSTNTPISYSGPYHSVHPQNGKQLIGMLSVDKT